MNTDLFTRLAQRLDAAQGRYSTLDHYYDGTQPLAFLAPEAREALGNRLGRIASNIPRLAVTALTERLRVTGFSGADVWDDWLANDLDQRSHVAHREALALGSSYATVWVNPDGSPRVAIESAKEVSVVTDPGSRQIIAALKRWETQTTTEAVLYEPDKITRLRANTTGATIGGFKTVSELPNPLGRPPVVRFLNGDRINTLQAQDVIEGVSEMDDLMPLVDALNKILADMMVTSEYVGRPRRWATGIELEEDEETGEAVSPIPEGDRAMVSENAEAKFGQLAAADLAGYEKAVNILLGQIMAVSALPGHFVGIMTDNPSSADAIRASEASLTARAEARQQTFGRAWEDVARLMVAVRDGTDPETVEPRVKWADPATRSEAQEADAIVKLVGQDILPVSYALKRLGYTDDEVTEIMDARRADALAAAGTNLAALIPAGAS